MTTNVVGNQGRVFQWQMCHYLTKGGPNDPELAATGSPPSSGGVLSWNSSVSRPPLEGPLTPPAQQLPRQQSLNSGGTFAANAITGNTGGILIGTIPQGANILDVYLTAYTGISGGTSTSVGIFYAPAGTFLSTNSPGLQPATLWNLAYITTPATGVSYSTRTGAGYTAFTAANATDWGPGNNTAASASQLASLGDIDIYAVSFLIAGGGTAPTGGCYQATVEYTGLVG